MRSEHFTSGLMLLLLLLVSSGCMVGPGYESPCVTLHQEWAGVDISDIVTISEAPTLVDWWRSFEDPLLDSLIAKAVACNWDLKVAQSKICQARATRRIAFSALFPEFDARLTPDRTHYSGTVLFGGILSSNRVFVLDDVIAELLMNWEVDLFGKHRRELEAATAEVCSAIENERDVLVTLLADVAQNYMELRGQQTLLRVTQDDVVAQIELSQLTTFRFEAGLTGALDVSQAQTLVDDTISAIPGLEGNILSAIYRLSILLGEEPQCLYAQLIEPKPVPLTIPDIPLGVPCDIIRRRPDIRRAEFDLMAANANIGVAIADLFPKLTLGAFFGFETNIYRQLFDTPSQIWQMAANLLQPIFDAGKRRANVNLARQQYAQLCYTYQNTVIQALADVRTSLVTYQKEQERYISLNKAAKSAQETFDIATLLYTTGLQDFLQVLAAERTLNSIRERRALSEQQVSTAAVALYKALGGGWEAYEHCQ